MTISRLKSPQLFRQQCHVDGRWIDAASGDTLEVHNPANGELVGRVPVLDAREITAAVTAASSALRQWRSRTAQERADRLMAWHDLVLENREDLATLMTLEQGKPITESRGEIDYAASFIRWFAEEARRMYGETIPGARPDQHIVVTRQPVGVCAAITPWNFPAAMITRKVAAALAAGCTMVVKPASATPFSALALAELAHQADIPHGVFNVVTGKADVISETLTGDSRVRKLSFTGSTDVGRRLMAQCAEHIQKISLELGGNAPFIVFDDADIERAVEGAMVCKFRNTGQTCVCANRFLVQSCIHDDFVAALAEAMGKLKVGDGFEEGVTQSALINEGAVEKVIEHFEDAMAKGANRVCGPEPDGDRGNYVQPVLLTDINTDMTLCHEETFGPLAAVIRFDTEEQAIELANATPFGLAAYFYTRDLHRMWRVADALEAGIVGINEGLISNPMAPFGGVKESGLGREGSRHGLDEYTELKYLCMGAE